jgi:nucleotide-binding universal stress UspA family protein
MNRIVVGYDGSEPARRALDRAVELADAAVVAVVCAADVSPLVRDPAGGASPIDPAHEEARGAALAEARQHLEGKGVEAVYVAGVGHPADVIVEEAKETGADLIVVGTRGLNAAKRIVLGSVSTNVVHHAPCDVLVVR